MAVAAAMVMLSGVESWIPMRDGGLAAFGIGGASRGLEATVDNYCTFDYPGPIHPESLNCFCEYYISKAKKNKKIPHLCQELLARFR
jgi:hypothetical protein